MKRLTVIDFFCGAGGFSEGFRQQGFKILKGYDSWQPAIDTFNHNFKVESSLKNILDFKDSIQEINLLPNTDVIIGSPPCVSFSSSNISGKADKKSGVLLTEIFLRIVAVKKFQKNSTLKAWFMENVANSRHYLNDYYTFKDLGLEEWAKENRLSPKKIAISLEENQPIINSADYGSFQARKRVISGEIIKMCKLIVPSATHSENEINGLRRWNSLRQIKDHLPSPASKNKKSFVQDLSYPEININTKELTDHFYDSGLYESEWKQSRRLKINHPYMGKMSFPENEDKPSRTITATKSGTSREALVYKSEYNRNGHGEYRTPTVREAASIMGFPITFQFLGSVNTKWRLVGNAVCPSVSRAFAEKLREVLKMEKLESLVLQTDPDLQSVPSLNTFRENIFDNPPKRQKNSRCRTHPIKEGNITVTLSNYNIEKNSEVVEKWLTSIQYGTGEGFPIQNIADNYFLEIESIVENLKNGKKFLKIINNGFSEKIGSSTELQLLYENQKSTDSLIEPVELVEELLKGIIEKYQPISQDFEQKEVVIFSNKSKIPTKQIFALYAINKISTLANNK
jgi:DNA (cytosine-5)-methyltransferase 1